MATQICFCKCHSSDIFTVFFSTLQWWANLFSLTRLVVHIKAAPHFPSFPSDSLTASVKPILLRVTAIEILFISHLVGRTIFVFLSLWCQFVEFVDCNTMTENIHDYFAEDPDPHICPQLCHP